MIARNKAIFFALVAIFIASSAIAQTNLRVVTWNVSAYKAAGTDPRNSAFQTAIYGVNPANSLSMSPDVFIGQEFNDQASVDSFLNNVLNAAPGSPGDWAAAPFVLTPGGGAGNAGESAFFYRTSKVSYLSTATVNPSSSLGTSGQPRNTYRYDVEMKGSSGALSGEKIGMYSVHMKSSTGATNENRRQVEADNIRRNAQGTDTNGAGSKLPAGYHFLMAGDTNMNRSTEAGFTTLTGATYNASAGGKLFDPINTPGSWDGSASFKFVHTQDPRGTGSGGSGMNSRFDMILLSESLKSGALTYVGNPSLAYSTSTWNDPNHSYRVWGNDGTQALNGQITTSGNAMVGTTIANAIVNTIPGTVAGGALLSGTGGHLPVFLDLVLASGAAVPEPGCLCLLALGALGGLTAWRRR